LKALARRIALAADPLRPSAGRAKPLDDVTSDALCRTTALALELQTSAFARTPHAAPCDEAHSDLRRARTRSIAACLRPPYTLPRTPSFGLMLSLAAEPSSFAITVRNVRRAPHPYRATHACSPCPERAAAPPCPAPPWLASRLTLNSPGRCVSPTSATDVRNEHPKIARLPSPQLALRRPPPR